MQHHQDSHPNPADDSDVISAMFRVENLDDAAWAISDYGVSKERCCQLLFPFATVCGVFLRVKESSAWLDLNAIKTFFIIFHLVETSQEREDKGSHLVVAYALNKTQMLLKILHHFQRRYD